MRDSMTPMQIVKWKAFRRIQTDPMDRLCVILKRGFAAMVGMVGNECSPDAFEPCDSKREPELIAGPGAMKQLLSPTMARYNVDGDR